MSRWAVLLDRNANLSDRYRWRYTVLLGQLEPGATRSQVAEAERLVLSHASRAVSTLVGARPARPPQATTWRTARAGSCADLIPHGQELDRLLAATPELEQTRAPVHPSRCARALAGGAVALRWPADSVDARIRNMERFSAVAASASQRSPIPIDVWSDYTIYSADRQHVWTIAPNLGTTLEDRLRTDVADRGQVLAALQALRTTMFDHGLVWQGFAPRNMFLVTDRLVLIDFEELVEIATDPVRAAECLLWHRVFFADCLDTAEAAALFNHEPIAVPDGTLVLPDAFEQALLGEEMITFANPAGPPDGKRASGRSPPPSGRHHPVRPRTRPLLGRLHATESRSDDL